MDIWFRRSYCQKPKIAISKTKLVRTYSYCSGRFCSSTFLAEQLKKLDVGWFCSIGPFSSHLVWWFLQPFFFVETFDWVSTKSRKSARINWVNGTKELIKRIFIVHFSSFLKHQLFLYTNLLFLDSLVTDYMLLTYW